MITTQCHIPPPILKSLSRLLLVTPLCEKNALHFWKIFVANYTKLLKKAQYHPNRLKKFMALKEEFLKLYERAKEKEKDPKTETSYAKKMPLYCPLGFDKRSNDIYWRLRKRLYSNENGGTNIAFQETQSYSGESGLRSI